MNVRELYDLLGQAIVNGQEAKEIRVGDQVESGPYLNASVGGVFQGRKGDVILCANDDEVWQDEAAGFHPDYELEKLWTP
jgi:hypothetical protein